MEVDQQREEEEKGHQKSQQGLQPRSIFDQLAAEGGRQSR